MLVPFVWVLPTKHNEIKWDKGKISISGRTRTWHLLLVLLWGYRRMKTLSKLTDDSKDKPIRDLTIHQTTGYKKKECSFYDYDTEIRNSVISVGIYLRIDKKYVPSSNVMFWPCFPISVRYHFRCYTMRPDARFTTRNALMGFVSFDRFTGIPFQPIESSQKEWSKFEERIFRLIKTMINTIH